MMMHHSLVHKINFLANYNRLIFSKFQLLRHLSTAYNHHQNPPYNRLVFEKQKLYKKLSSGENLSDVLDKLSRESNQLLNRLNLIHCIKKLRSKGHYQQCLEILEWMEKGGFADSHYGLRLNIIYKVMGIKEAEKYFDSLHPVNKDIYTYGTLLNCYCTEMMTDKALALFDKMEELNYASNDMAFSKLMCLYIKIDQPEKVPPLVEEMKRSNISLSSLCYQTWIQSYAALNDLAGIEQVRNEIQEQNSVKDDWCVYSNLVSAYIKVGQYEKAEPFVEKIEQILDSSINPDCHIYYFLIGFYANLGNLESVFRTWDKLKAQFRVANNVSYLTMLQALSKLDNIEHLQECYKEWNSIYKYYDVRLPTVVVSAYLRHDMVDEAELLLTDATYKAGQKIWAVHVAFMDYYLGKCKIDSALRHLEVALANQWPWQPLAGKLDRFFEYFIEEKDVNGAEQICQMLEKVQPLISSIYLGLLKTYVAAGRIAPEIHQRMVRDGVMIGMEHEELLQKQQAQQQDSLNTKRWGGLLQMIFPN